MDGESSAQRTTTHGVRVPFMVLDHAVP